MRARPRVPRGKEGDSFSWGDYSEIGRPALRQYRGLAQNARQWDNRYMQRSLTTALLLAAAVMLAGVGYAQQTPPASTPAATTPAAPAATTPKAPAKKTGTTTAKSAEPAPLKTRK